jgi:hypothetical protein
MLPLKTMLFTCMIFSQNLGRRCVEVEKDAWQKTQRGLQGAGLVLSIVQSCLPQKRSGLCHRSKWELLRLAAATVSTVEKLRLGMPGMQREGDEKKMLQKCMPKSYTSHKARVGPLISRTRSPYTVCKVSICADKIPSRSNVSSVWQENRSPQKTHRDHAVTQKRPTIVSKETGKSKPLLPTARKSGLDAAVEPWGKHQLPATQVQPQKKEHQHQQDAVVKKEGHLHEAKNVISAHSVLRSSLEKDAGMGLGCEEQLEVGWIEVGIHRAATDEERCDANETDMHETDMQSHAASRCEAGQQLLPPNKSVAHGEEELQDQVEAEPQPRRRSPVPTNFGERPPLGVAKRDELGSTALFETNGRKGPEGDRSNDDPQRCPRACAPEPRPQPTSAHGTPASSFTHPSYSALAARASSVARVKPPRPRTPGAAHLHRTPNQSPDNTPENTQRTYATCLPHDPAPSALCCGSSDAMRCSLEKSAHTHVVAYAAMPALDRPAVGEGGERSLQEVRSSATIVSQCPQQSAAPPRPKISQKDRCFNDGAGPAAGDISVEGVMRHHTYNMYLIYRCGITPIIYIYIYIIHKYNIHIHI